MTKRILTLHLKAKWWNKIASGEKMFELRRATEYWRKRLVGVDYGTVILLKGYPKKGTPHTCLIRKWKGIARETVVHEEFGTEPVDVFVISLGAME